MGSNKEIIPIVNSKDRVIGKTTKIEAKIHKFRHRGVHVFVLNEHGQILINQRASRKMVHPDKYDPVFGGYVKYGETYEHAVARETREELGLNYTPKFIYLGKFLCRDKLYGDFFAKTYTFILKGKYRLQKSEIKSAMWAWLSELNSLSKKLDFSPDRLQTLQKSLKSKKFLSIVKKLEEKTEFVSIVDKNDKVIGKTTVDEAAKKALRHRAVRIYLRDKDDNYLLLKRPKKKRYCPDSWEIGVSGNVRHGENYFDAAKREVFEETGYKIFRMKKLLKASEDNKIEKWHAIVYIAEFSGKPKFQKKEVVDYKFLKGEDVLLFLSTKNLSTKKIHPLAVKYFKILVKKGKIKLNAKKQEYWQLLDSNGNVKGKCIQGMKKEQAVKKKLWFASSNVVLFNKKTEILLQKRCAIIPYPLYWDISTAGHVNHKESFVNAAKREMLEEIGAKSNLSNLKEISRYSLSSTRNHYILFAAKYNGKLLPNWEVEELKWVSMKKAKAMAANNKIKTTPWLDYVIKNYSKELEDYARQNTR